MKSQNKSQLAENNLCHLAKTFHYCTWSPLPTTGTDELGINYIKKKKRQTTITNHKRQTMTQCSSSVIPSFDLLVVTTTHWNRFLITIIQFCSHGFYFSVSLSCPVESFSPVTARLIYDPIKNPPKLSYKASLFAAHFKLCKLSFVQSVLSCVNVPLCVSVCTCMYALRITSTDKILRFINTLIILLL